MLELLRREPAFRRLWLVEVVSSLGDWLTYVAVSLLALQRGEGLIAVALVLVAHTLPSTLLAPVAGCLVDRLDRRQVLVAANLLMGCTALAMAWAAAGGSLFWVQLLLLLRVAFSAFSEPAATASVPRLLGASTSAVIVPSDSARQSKSATPAAERKQRAQRDRDIATANRLLAASWSVLFALGVALGGLAAAAFGPTLAILLDALTFFIAAWISSGLPALAPEQKPHKASVLGELKAGVVHAARHRHILEAALGKAPAAIISGGGWVLLNEHARMQSGLGWLGQTALALGALQCVRAVGTGIGPLLFARLSPQDRSDFWWNATTGCTLLGVLALSVAHSVGVIALAVFAWGLGVGANWVAATSRLQRLAPDHLLGRLSALDLFGHTLGQCTGALCGALLAHALSEPRAAAWAGAAIGFTAWLLLRLSAARPLPEAAVQAAR